MKTTKAWIIVLLLAICHAQKNGFCLLQWNDEFAGPTLDLNKWQHEVTCNGGGNGELQCYTARDRNVFIEDGKLVLKVQKETYTGTQAGCTDTDGCTKTQPFTSGRVNTAKSPTGSFLRGRMEVRAKLCSGKRLWPAIWMLPTSYTYGGWAASGEIDMMEQRGDKSNVVSGTLHHGGAWPNNVYTTTGEHSFPFDVSQDYHVYAVEWTEDSMKWFVDDNNFQTYPLNRMWNSPSANPYTQAGQPWDQKFHFVLNVAVGGPDTGFFNGYPALTDADIAAWNVSEMRVDWVRVWRQGGDCGSIYPSTSSTDVKDMSSTTKMTIIIAATVGGFVFLAGIAGIVVAIVLLRRAKRRLNAAPTLSATSSQTHLTSW